MSKGKRRERQAAELYEEAGYRTYRPQESKFGETDMFGLFDVLAIGVADVRLAQVKSNRAAGVEKWLRVVTQYHPVETDFLVCHDREGWRLIQPEDIGGIRVEKRVVVDERGMDCAMGEGVVEWLRGDSDG